MIKRVSPSLLLFTFAVTTALFFCINIFGIYRVREHSMEPILHNGQTIFTIKENHPNRGDLIVFENPENKELVVKRYTLSPGDPLVISGGSLITGDRKIPLTNKQRMRLKDLKKIPEDMFFAMGDNTFNSHDSRDYGPVNMDNLKGRVIIIR